jgi:hypothetical protein
MKLRGVLTAVIAAACLPVVGTGTALGSEPRTADLAGRTAIKQTGNAGGVNLYSLSCPAAGDCVAGGNYFRGLGGAAAFVVSERNGHWGKAIEVPGTAALNANGFAEVDSVSCPSAGNCGASGYYSPRVGGAAAFVVSERNGHWGKAIEAPGTAALNAGGNADVDSVSCPSAGNCSAGGYYTDVGGRAQAMVLSERNGHWGKASEVPGTAALNAGGSADVQSVSCPSPGNCVAGGSYTDSAFRQQVFVVSERNGSWGKAIEVPGTAALNAGGDQAGVSSVSCPLAGNCGVGGLTTDGAGSNQDFVVNERNGSWGQAIVVPGVAPVNAGGVGTGVSTLSCPSPGNCVAAGGDFEKHRAFLAIESNGRWGKAFVVPGTAALNAGLSSVSCPSPGNCVAGGFYLDRAGNAQAFVLGERNGSWGKAIEVPGTGALNTAGDAGVNSVSCPPTGNCVADGSYADSVGFEAFVVNEHDDRWFRATRVEAP